MKNKKNPNFFFARVIGILIISVLLSFFIFKIWENANIQKLDLNSNLILQKNSNIFLLQDEAGKTESIVESCVDLTPFIGKRIKVEGAFDPQQKGFFIFSAIEI